MEDITEIKVFIDGEEMTDVELRITDEFYEIDGYKADGEVVRVDSYNSPEIPVSIFKGDTKIAKNEPKPQKNENP